MEYRNSLFIKCLHVIVRLYGVSAQKGLSRLAPGLARAYRDRGAYMSSAREKSTTETDDNDVGETFVPQSPRVTDHDINQLQLFMDSHKSLFVLTGAGMSTESGIPDYRSEGVGLYARSKNRPVQYQDFLKSSNLRQRYWARNYVGWPKFSSVRPNAAHRILAEWEKRGRVHWLVTQNVDALHSKAGSVMMTELHGCSHTVECLSCHRLYPRHYIQQYIDNLNTNWSAQSMDITPDGDVQLTQKQINNFQTPHCESCGGMLKPQVTFFGDNVPRKTVDMIHQKVIQSDAVLVAGSSLEVYSGYRFISGAADQGKPIAIVNIGPTRADKLSCIKLSVKCGDLLPYLQYD